MAVAVVAILGVIYYLVFYQGQGGIGVIDASQIYQYATGAGFSGDDAVTATAIALAESSGDTEAYNPETQANAPEGKGSYGLWQIYLNAHPEYAGENLYNPSTNASAAFDIYQNAGGFNPWSTYKNGAYQAHLQDAQDAANA